MMNSSQSNISFEDAFLSQTLLTGEEPILEEAKTYVSGLTKALVSHYAFLGKDLDEKTAEQIALQIFAQIDFRNPAVGETGFNQLVKHLIR